MSTFFFGVKLALQLYASLHKILTVTVGLVAMVTCYSSVAILFNSYKFGQSQDQLIDKSQYQVVSHLLIFINIRNFGFYV